MPSMIYTDEVDVGICGSSVKASGQFDSSFLAKFHHHGRGPVVLQPVRTGELTSGQHYDYWRLPVAAETIPHCQLSAFDPCRLGGLSSCPQMLT